MGSLGPTGRLDALASTSERSELLEVLQVLADRDRITRDLHEHVIGRLFGIGLTPAAGVLVLATTGDLDMAGHRRTVGIPSLPARDFPGDREMVNGSEHGGATRTKGVTHNGNHGTLRGGAASTTELFGSLS